MKTLSKRMAAIASFVPPGSRIADVGTDHGYIPICLVRDGTARSAIAMDVRSGPLSRAAEHVRECGLEDRISLRLGDGLSALKAGEADTVLISGMGGPLMREILSKGQSVAASVHCFVLSPQSDIPGVRVFLRENGYRIEREAFLLDEGKYYTVMQVFHGETGPVRYIEDQYGRYLLDRGDPVLREYLIRQEGRLRELLKKLQDSPRDETRRKAVGLKKEWEAVREALAVISRREAGWSAEKY